MIKRVIQLFNRQRVAARFGVKFKRCADFEFPESILIHGDRKEIHAPNENGVKVAFIDLILDDCYHCNEVAKNSKAPIRTVLDIGANVGLFDLMARSTFPEARIHAYEPNPHLETYLAKQAASSNTEYFMEAVGFEEGTVSLDFNDDSVQTRSKVDSSGELKQISFKQAVDRLGGSVDLLKMDCEGAEWEIFKDTETWQAVKNLSMEYHLWPDHTEEELIDILNQLNFKIKSFDPIENYGLVIASRA